MIRAKVFLLLSSCFVLSPIFAMPRMMQISTWHGTTSPSEQSRSTQYSTQANAMQKQLQSVCVLSGKSASLQYGEQRVTPKLSVNDEQMGVDLSQYKKVTSGLKVTPVAHNDYCELDIAEQRQQFNRVSTGQVDTQAAKTTLAIPYDKWIKYAGNGGQDKPTGSVTYSTKQPNRVDSNFYIKVHLLPVGQICR